MTRFTQVNKLLEHRLKRLLAVEKNSLQNWLCATLLLLPLTLIWLGGIWTLLGILYALAYCLLMLMPTALFVLIAFDALRLLTRRTPVFVPVLNATAAHTRESESEQDVWELILQLGIIGNPLNSVVREMWYLAFAFNPHAREDLKHASSELAPKKHPEGSGMTRRLIAAELKTTVPRHTSEFETVTAS
jgi:hypothetical protein